MEINKNLYLTFAVDDMHIHCEPLSFAQCVNHVVLLSCLKKSLSRCASINDFSKVAYPMLLKTPKLYPDSIEDNDIELFIKDITRGVNFVMKGEAMPVHWDIVMLRNNDKQILSSEAIHDIYSKLIFFTLESYFKMLREPDKAFAVWEIGVISFLNIMEFIDSLTTSTTTGNSTKKAAVS